MTVKPGQLAVVSTPIGNLADLSPRAAELLKKADILACEDTRTTRKLLRLSGHETTAKFIPYHDHNGQAVRPKLIKSISDGLNVALVSDAGTPLVSDPGYKLVAAAHECGFIVTAIPGPSAVLAGLACAGLTSDRFLFAGFVPNNNNAARKAFAEFSNLRVTSIWFVAPRRLGACLMVMADVFGPRLAVVARELTKLHEEIFRGPLDELANKFEKSIPPRGEIVILVEGGKQIVPEIDDLTLKAILGEEMQKNTLRDAVEIVAKFSGQQRRKIYQLAIEINKLKYQ